jgi:hypothetical protein
VSLLRYIVDPASELRTPALNPKTPNDDRAASAAPFQATHDDIEQWISDGFIWTFMGDENGVATQADIEDAYRRWVGFRETLEPVIDRLAKGLAERSEEFEQVFNEQGEKAARELLERAARKLLEEGHRGS